MRITKSIIINERSTIDRAIHQGVINGVEFIMAIPVYQSMQVQISSRSSWSSLSLIQCTIRKKNCNKSIAFVHIFSSFITQQNQHFHLFKRTSSWYELMLIDRTRFRTANVTLPYEKLKKSSRTQLKNCLWIIFRFFSLSLCLFYFIKCQ